MRRRASRAREQMSCSSPTCVRGFCAVRAASWCCKSDSRHSATCQKLSNVAHHIVVARVGCRVAATHTQVLDVRHGQRVEVKETEQMTPTAFIFLYENQLFLTFKHRTVAVWNFRVRPHGPQAACSAARLTRLCVLSVWLTGRALLQGTRYRPETTSRCITPLLRRRHL